MLSKYIKNARGYTLLITVVIIILFSIVGLSLMSLSINGSTKNNSREATSQSLNLSEKGLDYLTNKINTELTNVVKNGVSKDDYIDLIEQYYENNPKYKCTFNEKGELVDGLKIKTNNSEDVSIACIKAVHPADDGNELKRILEIVSVGKVNGKLQQITAFQEIGPDKVPEQLKYALTSKGNIHLNGAVQIIGDLRFDGNLTTYEKAHIISSGSHHWVNSIKPTINSSSNKTNPRIVVSNQSKFYNVKYEVSNPKSTDNQSLYDNIHNLTTYTNKNKSGVVQTNDVTSLFNQEVFNKPQTVVTTDSNINTVTISDSNYFFEKKSSGIIYSEEKKYYIFDERYDGKIPSGTYNNTAYLKHKYKECGLTDITCSSTKESFLDTKSSFTLNGTYEFKNKVATDASLKIISDSNKTTKVKFKNTLYVNGDLIIKGNVELEGNIYVKGKLKVDGDPQNNTNLKTNALIYIGYDSNKENAVDIQYSKINSLPYTNSEGKNKNGTLVIFSKGGIKLSNNSVYSDHTQPSEIYGYLYSDRALEIYGVGSNIKIYGGVYGNRITLHAIRGNSKSNNTNFPNSTKYGDDYYLNADKQDDYTIKNANEMVNDSRCNYPDNTNKKKCYDYHSRLQIIYNDDVISTFNELNQEHEALIYDVSPPRLIDKQY